MVENRVLDQVVVMSDPCEITLQFIERQDGNNTVYVVCFKVGDDDPKETISRDRQYIEDAYNNAKLVIV